MSSLLISALNESLPADLRDRIPQEVYDNILPYLNKSNIAAISRVSSRCYVLTTPLLYGSSFNIKLQDPVHTLSGRTVSTGRMTTLSRLSELVPNPFVHCTHLTLTSHGNRFCADLQPLIMPSLQTLAIRQYSSGYLLNACIPEVFAFYDRSPLDGATCHLLQHLRTRRICFFGGEPQFQGEGAGLWTSHHRFPPPWVEELVLDFKYDPATCRNHWLSRSFLHRLPNTLKRLVLVLSPDTPSWLWYVQTGEEGRYHTGDEWCQLAEAMKGDAQTVELVGFERVAESWGVSSGDVVRRIKDILVYLWIEEIGQYRSWRWTLRRVEQLERKIKLVSMAEYQEREGM